jgi:hypothetical protein
VVDGTRRVVLVAIALVVSGAATVAGIASSRSNDDAVATPVERRALGGAASDTVRNYAAGIANDDDVDTMVRSHQIWPVRNYWAAADGVYETVVIAGRDPDEKSVGMFAIHRRNYAMREPAFDTEFVEVPGAGTLKITDAPSGRGRVQSRSQFRGRISFESAGGIRGTLDLRDESIALTG